MKGVYIALIIIAIVLVILKYPQELRWLFIVLFKYIKRIVARVRHSDIEQPVSRTSVVEEVTSKESEQSAMNAQRDDNIEWLVNNQKKMQLQLNGLQKNIEELIRKSQMDYSIDKKIDQMTEKLQNLLLVSERQRQVESDKKQLEPVGRQSSNNTFYADSVDSSSPLGFLEINLSDVFSNQFFVIEQFSPDRAVFRFVDDPNMQKLLISSMYQLIGNGICEIEGECVSVPTSIQIISDGMLQLKNGVWVITKKVTLNLI